jgi:hypothetical protein
MIAPYFATFVWWAVLLFVRMTGVLNTALVLLVRMCAKRKKHYLPVYNTFLKGLLQLCMCCM